MERRAFVRYYGGSSVSSHLSVAGVVHGAGTALQDLAPGFWKPRHPRFSQSRAAETLPVPVGRASLGRRVQDAWAFACKGSAVS